MFKFLKPSTDQRSTPSPRPRTRLHLEDLENRCLMTVLTPVQVRHAYGFDQLPYDGSGQTIALILANDNPTVAQDLHAFDRQFGLPDPTLLKATEVGRIAYDPGWAVESSLDVEWAHAIAPHATLLLVEAASASLSDLMGAVDYARHYPGVSVVSMSWGGGEFAGENQFDAVFTTPTGHTGVTFVAASGDTGGQTNYPSTSPNVVAVGGTSLTVSGSTYVRETAWSGSGGGVSSYESLPTYQAGAQTTGRRTTPDVAYNADPNDGVIVDSGGTWYSVGGTSAGTPQWAGLFALVDQGLSLKGAKPLDGRSQALPALYSLARSHYSTDFHDITSGRAGSFSAKTGYDLATGLGSPIANNLVPGLIGYVTGTSATTTGSNTGRTTGPSQGLRLIIRLDMFGPETGGNLGFAVAGFGAASPSTAATLPTGAVLSADVVSRSALNPSLRLTEPATPARTLADAPRLAHSPLVNAPRDIQTGTGEENTGTPADDSSAPEPRNAPMPFDFGPTFSGFGSLSSLRIPSGRRDTESPVVPVDGQAGTSATTESRGLAAAAALVVAFGGVSRGVADEAEARRRRFSAGQRS